MEDAEDGKVERELWLSRDGSEHRGKAEALRDYGVDAPLDLSDTGRGKGMGWIKHQEANSPRLSPGDSPMHGPCRRHGMERDSSQPHSCWHDAAQTQLTGQPGAIKEEEEEEELFEPKAVRGHSTHYEHLCTPQPQLQAPAAPTVDAVLTDQAQTPLNDFPSVFLWVPLRKKVDFSS